MKKLWRVYRNTSFVIKVSVGFLLGIITGLVVGPAATIVSPLGDLLLRLLNMIAIPVIFLTVVLAVDQMNPKQLGRVGSKLFLYYLTTTAAAVSIGFGLAAWTNPGEGLSLGEEKVEVPETPSVSEVFLNIVPKNMFEAFTSGDILAILFLAIIIGLSIAGMRFSTEQHMRQYGETLHHFAEAANKMLFRILTGVLEYAPIGVFAISATTFGKQGMQTVESLAKLVGVFYGGIAILWLLVYGMFLIFYRIPIMKFLKDTKEAYTTAFFTSSSIASLPVAMDAAKRAGISDRIVNFSLPLGAAFNSDGGALRMGVSVIFAANVAGIQMSGTELLIIVLTGTLLSVGTAGVPAAGLVSLSIVLQMFNLPIEIVALIAGVDALIGMVGTASNVMGDLVGAAVVNKSEEKFIN
ncbi:dicarboxylate/amino acid:cation symporter [Bacillus tianshenii]|nr:dicarboxylate/amino acid:cation symporter [Bacillus tianshenii]